MGEDYVSIALSVPITYIAKQQWYNFAVTL